MKRLTQFSPDKNTYITIKNELSSEAIHQLAKYEILHEHLLTRQEMIPVELQGLRNAGKDKTVTFRELLSEKLMIDMMLNEFKKHGL